MNKTNFCVGFVCLAIGLSGCASPKTRGAVVPMEGEKYQSVVKRGDKESALSAVDHDAKLTCGKPGMLPGKIEEGRYEVVSQNVAETAAKEAESTGNVWADKALKIKFGDRGTAATYEVTTVFKCKS